MNMHAALSEIEVARLRYFELAALIDAAEYISSTRMDDAPNNDSAIARQLEAELSARVPECAADAEWLGRRLARAVENQWEREFMEPLARALIAYGRTVGMPFAD